jgi:hypothetical protein
MDVEEAVVAHLKVICRRSLDRPSKVLGVKQYVIKNSSLLSCFLYEDQNHTLVFSLVLPLSLRKTT